METGTDLKRTVDRIDTRGISKLSTQVLRPIELFGYLLRIWPLLPRLFLQTRYLSEFVTPEPSDQHLTSLAYLIGFASLPV
jgi:hypothetical protein